MLPEVIDRKTRSTVRRVPGPSPAGAGGAWAAARRGRPRRRAVAVLHHQHEHFGAGAVGGASDDRALRGRQTARERTRHARIDSQPAASEQEGKNEQTFQQDALTLTLSRREREISSAL